MGIQRGIVFDVTNIEEKSHKFLISKKIGRKRIKMARKTAGIHEICLYHCFMADFVIVLGLTGRVIGQYLAKVGREFFG